MSYGQTFDSNATLQRGCFVFGLFMENDLAAKCGTVSAPGDALGKFQIIFSVLLLIVILVCVVILRKYKFFTVGWLWYFITLIPVIGIVQVGSQAYADRYTYTPLIGVFVIMAFSGAMYLSNRNYILVSFLLIACWTAAAGQQVRCGK
jgi:hypothetical protein